MERRDGHLCHGNRDISDRRRHCGRTLVFAAYRGIIEAVMAARHGSGQTSCLPQQEELDMLATLMLAAAPCINITDFGPLLNTSVYEITEVWAYADPGKSFVWRFKDGTNVTNPSPEGQGFSIKPRGPQN
jgi:hypothetical protein